MTRGTVTRVTELATRWVTRLDGAWVIGLDTHCAFTVAAVIRPDGVLAGRRKVATDVLSLRRLIEGVQRPRHVVLEEGPLADWLVRELRDSVDAVVSCDPRRNAHIAKDGDKDDPIDALKLGQLYRGGFVSAVHQCGSLERSAFKQFVGLYHDRVRNLVRQSNRILGQLRRHGVFGCKADLGEPERRRPLLAAVPSKLLRTGVQILLREFDQASSDVERLRRMLAHEGRRYEAVQRFTELPGIGWVRAATFFAYVDTPWRFRSKQALWRYMGIGLERRRSGEGWEQIGVPASVKVCRALKGMILGAARSAVIGDNPFARRYKEQRDGGLSPRNAIRSTARSLAATLWGMLKNGDAYRPDRVGVAAAAGPARVASQADG